MGWHSLPYHSLLPRTPSRLARPRAAGPGPKLLVPPHQPARGGQGPRLPISGYLLPQVDDLKATLAIQEAELKQKNENADKLIHVVGVETEKVSKEKAIADEEEAKVEVINKVRTSTAPKHCHSWVCRAGPPSPEHSVPPPGPGKGWEVLPNLQEPLLPRTRPPAQRRAVL